MGIILFLRQEKNTYIPWKRVSCTKCHVVVFSLSKESVQAVGSNSYGRYECDKYYNVMGIEYTLTCEEEMIKDIIE